MSRPCEAGSKRSQLLPEMEKNGCQIHHATEGEKSVPHGVAVRSSPIPCLRGGYMIMLSEEARVRKICASASPSEAVRVREICASVSPFGEERVRDICTSASPNEEVRVREIRTTAVLGKDVRARKICASASHATMVTLTVCEPGDTLFQCLSSRSEIAAYFSYLRL